MDDNKKLIAIIILSVLGGNASNIASPLISRPSTFTAKDAKVMKLEILGEIAKQRQEIEILNYKIKLCMKHYKDGEITSFNGVNDGIAFIDKRKK